MACDMAQFKWYSDQVTREVARDPLSIGARIGEALSIVVSVIVMAFIAIHQTRPTGFFTEDYGSAAASVLYFMIIFGMIPPAVRLLLGRRNLARPLESVGMGVFAAGSVYLLAVFPFDMSRLAEPLPRSMEFLLDWVPESLAKLVLVIGILASVFFAPYTYLLHVSVKARLSEGASEAPSEDEPTT